MRPNPSHDPTIQTVEEPSDLGPRVIRAPPPQEWVEFLDQLLGFQGHVALGSLPDLVHETTDRFLARIRVQRTRTRLATDLALGQM